MQDLSRIKDMILADPENHLLREQAVVLANRYDVPFWDSGDWLGDEYFHYLGTILNERGHIQDLYFLDSSSPAFRSLTAKYGDEEHQYASSPVMASILDREPYREIYNRALARGLIEPLPYYQLVVNGEITSESFSPENVRGDWIGLVFNDNPPESAMVYRIDSKGNRSYLRTPAIHGVDYYVYPPFICACCDEEYLPRIETGSVDSDYCPGCRRSGCDVFLEEGCLYQAS